MKSVRAISLALLMICSLAGCGEISESGTQTDSSETVTETADSSSAEEISTDSSDNAEDTANKAGSAAESYAKENEIPYENY